MAQTTFRKRIITGAVAVLAAAGLAVGPATGAAQAQGTPQTSGTISPESSLSADFSGRWVEAAPNGGGYLAFGPENHVSGNDGCNGIGSDFTTAGNVAFIEPFASTQLACDGPWSPWLQQARSVHHYGLFLTVHGADGEFLGVLRPAVDNIDA